LKRLAAERERSAEEFHTVLSRGEEVLDRAHQVAHEIEEKVRRTLQMDYRGNGFPTAPTRREKGSFSKPGSQNPSNR
jgi:hypothetical protein